MSVTRPSSNTQWSGRGDRPGLRRFAFARRRSPFHWVMSKVLIAAVVGLVVASPGCVRDRVASRAGASHSSAVVSTSGPFRHYDEGILKQVEERWHRLLAMRPPNSLRTGKVVLLVHLQRDGRVTDIEVLENTSDRVCALLCQKAILDAQPFPPWPEETQKIAGENNRRMQFSFHYDEDQPPLHSASRRACCFVSYASSAA